MTPPSPSGPSPATEDGLDEVLAAARVLWPAPLDVHYSKSRGRSRAAGEQILLPGPAAPRICVPADTRVGAARAVMRFSSALAPRQFATRLASAVAIGTGPRALFPHRLVIEGATPDGLRDHLAAALGRPVSFGFGIGTARPNRKPVLALFGSDGSRLGFAKIGVDPFTDAQVTRERDALQEISRHAIKGVRTPALLHSGTWDGHPVLVIGALTPSPWQTARRGDRTPYAQLEAFGAAFGVQKAPLSDSPWWATIRSSVSELPAGAARDGLQRAFETIESRWAGIPLRLGAWHGDWTPWNMGWSRGTLLLWDFERFDLGAPIGLDACHYATSVPAPTDDPEEIVRRLAGAQPGGDAGTADLVKAVYLVAITTRYQVAAGSENGWLIEPRATIMDHCLARWLDRSADGGVTGEPG